MTKNIQQKAVLVLGMHRSGTSALTAGLTALGFHFGHNETHASEENPKGYFENQAVVQLNDKILRHLGYSWSNPFWGTHSVDLSALQKFVPGAVDLLKKSYTKSTCWGIKDPRVCLLLPFWEQVIKEAFDCDVYYVHALRHPLEVASSLKVRSTKFKQFLCGDTRQSVLLWFSYHFCSLRDASNDRNILINFDDLIESPLKQIDRLINFLDINPDVDSLDDYVKTFLTKGLKHHSSSTEIFSKDFPQLQCIARFYNELSSLKFKDEFNRKKIKDILAIVPVSDLFQSCCDASAPLFQDAQKAILISDKFEQSQNTILGLKEKNAVLIEANTKQNVKLTNLEQQTRALSIELQKKERTLVGANKQLNDFKRQWTWKIADRIRKILKKTPLSRAITKRLYSARDKKKISHEYQILSKANGFDKDFYMSQAPFFFEIESDPLTHYLTKGTQQGLWPNRNFDPLFYLQMYPDVKVSGQNPLVHYLIAGKEEGRLTQNRPLDSDVRKVISNPSEGQEGHYFDPDFYQRAYPDTGGLDPLIHYNTYGRLEGRIPCQSHPIDFSGVEQLNKDKATILVVSHDASATGGPTLCLKIIEHLKVQYNVITLLIGGGPQLQKIKDISDFVVEPVRGNKTILMPIIVEQLSALITIDYAIVNTTQSRYVLPGLAQCFIPSICLIHEFISYIRPKSAIREIVLWASEVVFSSEIVRQDAIKYCEALKHRQAFIYPQGQCASTTSETTLEPQEQKHIQNKVRPNHFPDDTVIILGAGTVELRKGVDLFLGCATRLRRLSPGIKFHFVWAGKGFDPEKDTEYSSFIQDQLERDGLQDHVTFVGQLSNLSFAYAVADIFFLSSRLDPLPNVAIDAMFHGLPVVCFENTGGISDFLIEKGRRNSCVAPYLNTEKAAELLNEIIRNPDKGILLGEELKEFATQYFNMESYVKSLDDLAKELTPKQELEKRDCLLLENNNNFYLNNYLSHDSFNDHKLVVRRFIRSWQSGEGLRKPNPSFHPGIYAEQNSDFITTQDPFAHYLEANCPKGPWKTDLIQPKSGCIDSKKKHAKAALHIHVFYIELLDNILEKLEWQNLSIDLLISVTNAKIAEQVSRKLALYNNGTVEIKVVPNQGRDIGPLLTEFSANILENYELIGHLHTKKSIDIKDRGVISKWFDFLLENLLGKRFPMTSIILDELSTNEKVGLVFPSDPYVVGWSNNKTAADLLCQRLRLPPILVNNFNFPVGSMFWAKTAAIAPLFATQFKWEDYPKEPVSYDGTMLHAIERLLPFIAENEGFEYKMTYIPNITR